MEQNTMPEELSAAASAAVQQQRSVSRALERAALRELRSRKREQYAREDAEDAAVVAQLHAERLAADDASVAERWQMNVDRELARAEARSNWVDQHAAAVEMRREVRGEQRRLRAEEAEQEHRREQELREERLAAQDEYAASVWQMNVDRELSIAALRDAWAEAHGRSIEARRAYKEAMREARREAAKTRPERQAADKAARAERIEKEDARGAAIRAAVKERFFATTQRRDAQRAGASADEVARLRERERELKEAEERLCAQIREERLAEEDARFRALSEEGKAKVAREALAREEWLLNKQIAVLERRKVKEAAVSIKAGAKATQGEATALLREERNARVEASRDELRQMYTAREMRLAQMQERYLQALEAERAELRRVRAAEREAAPAIRESEAAQAARRREERLEREAAEGEAFRQLAKERAYSRSLERDAAIASAQVAYRAMCGNMDEQGVK